MAARCVLDARASFGECPIWHEGAQALYWIDVGAPSVNRFDPATGSNRSWPMPEPVGALALADDGRIVVALKSGVHLFDMATGTFEFVVDPEPERPANRLNDGRCDRRGRFWIGSMLDPVDPTQRPGTLNSVAGATARRWTEGLGTSNGIAFSPDDKWFYHSDSFAGVRSVWRYEYDLDDGVISNRQVFVDTHGMGGRPDGGTVDTEGCYWSASNDGWAVIRYTPVGAVDQVVQVPVSKPSMPCFGGPDLRTLYVTSLRPPGLDTRDQPLAGGIFAIDLPQQGLIEPRFAVPRKAVQ
jgi:sugar lactone lactonase YvrE